jgi:hypothetical protein
MIVKCTAIFNQVSARNRVGGWSESWCINANSISAAQDDFRSWCYGRAVLLSGAGKIIGQRFSDTAVPGVSIATAVNYPGAARVIPDIPQMALEVVARAAGGSFRIALLRGIPDAKVYDGEYLPTQPFNNAVMSLFTQVMNRWGWVGIDKTNAMRDVSAISSGGAVTTVQTLALTPGDHVQFYRTRDILSNSIKGSYLVTAVADNLHFTVGSYANAAAVRGRVRKLAKAFIVPVNYSIVKIVVRKVGRPFGGYVGRRSKVG